MSFTDTCASRSTCNECTEWGCIWCGDETGCHAELSPYGCIHAEPCDSVLHCKRKHPDPLPHSAYAHVNGPATTLTVLALVVLLIVFYFIMRFVVKYRKRKLKMKRHLLGDFELQRFLDEPYRVIPNQPSRHPEARPFQRGVMSHSVLNIRSFRRDIAYQHPIDHRKDKCVRFTGCVLSSLSAVALSVSVMVILLFPTTPSYYVCDTETDWQRIWAAMEHLSAQTQYDILFSVENNNYFSTELTNIGIRIFYEKELIGHYYSSDQQEGEDSSVYLPHHSMTDILLPVAMNPSIFKAYSIWELYQSNALPLEIDFFADTSTYFLSKEHDWKLLDMHLSLQIQDYVVGANITTDRTGCNCPARVSL